MKYAEKPSIAGLCLLVLASGLFFAALREPSPMRASVVVTSTLAILLASTLGAVLSRRRAMWLGFAVFGWGLAVAIAVAGFELQDDDPLTRLSVVAYDRIQANGLDAILKCPDDNTVSDGPPISYSVGGFQRWTAAGIVFPLRPDLLPFQRIFRCATILIAGLAGSRLAARFAARGARPSP